MSKRKPSQKQQQTITYSVNSISITSKQIDEFFKPLIQQWYTKNKPSVKKQKELHWTYDMDVKTDNAVLVPLILSAVSSTSSDEEFIDKVRNVVANPTDENSSLITLSDATYQSLNWKNSDKRLFEVLQTNKFFIQFSQNFLSAFKQNQTLYDNFIKSFNTTLSPQQIDTFIIVFYVFPITKNLIKSASLNKAFLDILCEKYGNNEVSDKDVANLWNIPSSIQENPYTTKTTSSFTELPNREKIPQSEPELKDKEPLTYAKELDETKQAQADLQKSELDKMQLNSQWDEDFYQKLNYKDKKYYEKHFRNLDWNEMMFQQKAKDYEARKKERSANWQKSTEGLTAIPKMLTDWIALGFNVLKSFKFVQKAINKRKFKRGIFSSLQILLEDRKWKRFQERINDANVNYSKYDTTTKKGSKKYYKDAKGILKEFDRNKDENTTSYIFDKQTFTTSNDDIKNRLSKIATELNKYAELVLNQTKNTKNQVIGFLAKRSDLKELYGESFNTIDFDKKIQQITNIKDKIGLYLSLLSDKNQNNTLAFKKLKEELGFGGLVQLDTDLAQMHTLLDTIKSANENTTNLLFGNVLKQNARAKLDTSSLLKNEKEPKKPEFNPFSNFHQPHSFKSKRTDTIKQDALRVSQLKKEINTHSKETYKKLMQKTNYKIDTNLFKDSFNDDNITRIQNGKDAINQFANLLASQSNIKQKDLLQFLSNVFSAELKTLRGISADENKPMSLSEFNALSNNPNSLLHLFAVASSNKNDSNLETSLAMSNDTTTNNKKVLVSDNATKGLNNVYDIEQGSSQFMTDEEVHSNLADYKKIEKNIANATSDADLEIAQQNEANFQRALWGQKTSNELNLIDSASNIDDARTNLVKKALRNDEDSVILNDGKSDDTNYDFTITSPSKDNEPLTIRAIQRIFKQQGLQVSNKSAEQIGTILNKLSSQKFKDIFEVNEKNDMVYYLVNQKIKSKISANVIENYQFNLNNEPFYANATILSNFNDLKTDKNLQQDLDAINKNENLSDDIFKNTFNGLMQNLVQTTSAEIYSQLTSQYKNNEEILDKINKDNITAFVTKQIGLEVNTILNSDKSLQNIVINQNTYNLFEFKNTDEDILKANNLKVNIDENTKISLQDFLYRTLILNFTKKESAINVTNIIDRVNQNYQVLFEKNLSQQLNQTILNLNDLRSGRNAILSNNLDRKVLQQQIKQLKDKKNPSKKTLDLITKKEEKMSSLLQTYDTISKSVLDLSVVSGSDNQVDVFSDVAMKNNLSKIRTPDRLKKASNYQLNVLANEEAKIEDNTLLNIDASIKELSRIGENPIWLDNGNFGDALVEQDYDNINPSDWNSTKQIPIVIKALSQLGTFYSPAITINENQSILSQRLNNGMVFVLNKNLNNTALKSFDKMVIRNDAELISFIKQVNAIDSSLKIKLPDVTGLFNTEVVSDKLQELIKNQYKPMEKTTFNNVIKDKLYLVYGMGIIGDVLDKKTRIASGLNLQFNNDNDKLNNTAKNLMFNSKHHKQNPNIEQLITNSKDNLNVGVLAFIKRLLFSFYTTNGKQLQFNDGSVIQPSSNNNGLFEKDNGKWIYHPSLIFDIAKENDFNSFKKTMDEINKNGSATISVNSYTSNKQAPTTITITRDDLFKSQKDFSDSEWRIIWLVASELSKKINAFNQTIKQEMSKNTWTKYSGLIFKKWLEMQEETAPYDEMISEMYGEDKKQEPVNEYESWGKFIDVSQDDTNENINDNQPIENGTIDDNQIVDTELKTDSETINDNQPINTELKTDNETISDNQQVNTETNAVSDNPQADAETSQNTDENIEVFKPLKVPKGYHRNALGNIEPDWMRDVDEDKIAFGYFKTLKNLNRETINKFIDLDNLTPHQQILAIKNNTNYPAILLELEERMGSLLQANISHTAYADEEEQANHLFDKVSKFLNIQDKKATKNLIATYFSANSLREVNELLDKAREELNQNVDYYVSKVSAKTSQLGYRATQTLKQTMFDRLSLVFAIAFNQVSSDILKKDDVLNIDSRKIKTFGMQEALDTSNQLRTDNVASSNIEKISERMTSEYGVEGVNDALKSTMYSKEEIEKLKSSKSAMYKIFLNVPKDIIIQDYYNINNFKEGYMNQEPMINNQVMSQLKK